MFGKLHSEQSILRWHRLGLSVKGNTATIIVDCEKQQNRPLQRRPGESITTSGIILLAQQIDDNTFFEASQKRSLPKAFAKA